MTSAITTAAISSSRSHGHSGVPELSAGAAEVAAGGDLVVGVDVTVFVLVFVAVDVCVEVWVDVSVDVSVEVCVFVDVSVEVDVVWLDDVRVGSVRVALGVGPSDGGEVGTSEGPVVCPGAPSVREGLGRLLPPAHAASSTARIAQPTTSRTVPRRITFDPPTFVSRPPPERYRHVEPIASEHSRAGGPVRAGPSGRTSRDATQPHWMEKVFAFVGR